MSEMEIVRQIAEVRWDGSPFIRVREGGGISWKARGYERWIRTDSDLWHKLECSFKGLLDEREASNEQG